MKELDYHPNAVAQSLRTQKTNVIGAVISDITNPFFATLIRGAEDAAIGKKIATSGFCNVDR
jgi:LacI family transcriptional regulator